MNVPRSTTREGRQADLDALNAPIVSPGSVGPQRRIIIGAGLFFAVGFGLFGLGFGLGNRHAETGEKEAKVAEGSKAAAALADPDLPLDPKVVELSGRVVARRSATVSSAYTAQLKVVHVREGDHVQAGQVVAELDASEAVATRRGAENRVEQLRASERRAAASEALAQLQLARGEILAKNGYVTKARLDELRAAAKSATADVAAARYSREVAKSDLQSAGIVLRRLVVRAPFSGVVSAVTAEAGEIVSPVSAGGGFVRTGICTLVDLGSREVEAFVPERQLANLAIGTEAEVSSQAIPGQRFRARLSAIGSEIDLQRAAVKVRIALLDFDPRLLPNMTVAVRLNTRHAGREELR